jgi:hypothetical protein
MLCSYFVRAYALNGGRTLSYHLSRDRHVIGDSVIGRSAKLNREETDYVLREINVAHSGNDKVAGGFCISTEDSRRGI